MTVGFTCGSFDLLHTGHLLMLEQCKHHCDYLIVGLQTDPTIDRQSKHLPLQSVFERHLALRACKYVDEIVVYETEADLFQLLVALDIDLRFLGEDWADLNFTGCGLPISVHFTPRNHNYSTSNLRERLMQEPR